MKSFMILVLGSAFVVILDSIMGIKYTEEVNEFAILGHKFVWMFLGSLIAMQEFLKK